MERRQIKKSQDIKNAFELNWEGTCWEDLQVTANEFFDLGSAAIFIR